MVGYGVVVQPLFYKALYISISMPWPAPNAQVPHHTHTQPPDGHTAMIPAAVSALPLHCWCSFSFLGIPISCTPFEAKPFVVSDTALPDAALPDAALPGAALPDAALPGAALPGAALPDAALPGAALPDAALPGAALPGAAYLSMPGTELSA
jgi:hypothetical protein